MITITNINTASLLFGPLFGLPFGLSYIITPISFFCFYPTLLGPFIYKVSVSNFHSLGTFFLFLHYVWQISKNLCRFEKSAWHIFWHCTLRTKISYCERPPRNKEKWSNHTDLTFMKTFLHLMGSLNEMVPFSCQVMVYIFWNIVDIF